MLEKLVSPIVRLITLSSLLASFGLYAEEERWYEVEILVFSHTTSKSYDSEKWPINIKSSLPAETLELKDFKIKPPLPEALEDSVPEMPEAFTLIDPSEYQFQKIPLKLQESNGYEVLVHKAWRQPLIKNRRGVPVLIDDEVSLNAYQEFSHNEEWVDPAVLEDELTYSVETPVSLEIDENKEFPASDIQLIISEDDPIDLEWGLSAFTETQFQPDKQATLRQFTGPEELRTFGTVTLKMSRFLHLSIDMYFRTDKPKIVVPDGLMAANFPMDSDEKEKTIIDEDKSSNEFLESLELDPVDFRLKDSQRIKTKEIYYFDHPLFGILTMVTPIEIPEVEEETIN